MKGDQDAGAMANNRADDVVFRLLDQRALESQDIDIPVHADRDVRNGHSDVVHVHDLGGRVWQ